MRTGDDGDDGDEVGGVGYFIRTGLCCSKVLG